ncbi:MAG: hypothetical protein H6722_26575 [Sandaracinus sp.]|nr:hypothetical protein [Sandaracinus sp.]
MAAAFGEVDAAFGELVAADDFGEVASDFGEVEGRFFLRSRRLTEACLYHAGEASASIRPHGSMKRT